MRRTTVRRVGALGVMVVCGGVALGQDGDGRDADAEATPREDPALADPSLADRAEVLQRRRSGLTAVAEGMERGAGVRGDGSDLPPRDEGLIREGAFLVERQGILRPLKNGSWALVFDGEGLGEFAPRAMVLQPSIVLTEMVRLAGSSEGIVTFRVSGEVFAYRGRNYLLPTFFSIVGSGEDGMSAKDAEGEGGGEAGGSEAGGDEVGEGDGAGDGAEAEETAVGADDGLRSEVWAELFEGSGGDGERVDGTDGADADVDELLGRLEDLEAGEDGARGSSAGAGARRGSGGGSGDRSEEGALMREGLMLSGLVGRLDRAGGDATLAFDNDTDQAGASRPMRVMPGLILEGMERAAERYGENVRFSVSGRVYVYEGRNWLLPTMYTVAIDPMGNLTPAQ